MCLVFIGALPTSAEPPITISIAKLPEGGDWIRYADPAAGAPGQGAGVDNDICSAETSAFDHTMQYILTASKADGRLDEYVGEDLTEGTAHVRLWNLDGDLIWDIKRSRGADDNNDGRPDDQPADGVDEIEIAAFTTHESNKGQFVAAAGEDRKIEVFRIRDTTDGPLLETPVYVTTLPIPAARAGAVDGMTFSSNGELLLAGTEDAGKVEIWRTTGDPTTWEHVGWANHGGSGDQAVNEVAITSDDQYVITAGTNRTGKFWRLDVTRDGSGEVTSANLVQLAHMTDPSHSCKGVAFEPGQDRYVILSSIDGGAWVWDVQELIAWGNPNSAPAPVQEMHNGNLNGGKAGTGNRIEPLVYSSNGRFMAQGGGPSGVSFIRIYEAAQFQETGPEPDPVFAALSHNNEFFEFNADDTLLATAHGDGTVRLWEVDISGTWTIAAEGFNEKSPTHSRWTLTGGGADWEISGEEDVVVAQDADFIGHRGSRYLAGDDLAETDHTLTLNDTWDLTGYTDLQVQFAAAANTGKFEDDEDDALRLLADTTGDGNFETTIAEFLPNSSSGNLALNGVGQELGLTFQDFFIDLEPLLPADHNKTIRFRIVANSSSSTEEICFDSLRVTGRPEAEIEDFKPLSGGAIQIDFPTYAIFNYKIWHSQALQDWFLATTREGSGALESWIDDGTHTGAHPRDDAARFYRISVVRKGL